MKELIITAERINLGTADISDYIAENCKDIRKKMPCYGEDFFGEYLNIPQKIYEGAVIRSAVYGTGLKGLTTDGCEYVIHAVSGLCIMVQGWDGERVEIPESYCISRQKPVTAATISPGLRTELCRALLEAEENGYDYLENEGHPQWFDTISTDPDRVIAVINELKEILFSPMKSFISKRGLTQKAFATNLMIPIRTVEDWAQGKTECKPYTRLLLAEYFWNQE